MSRHSETVSSPESFTVRYPNGSIAVDTTSGEVIINLPQVQRRTMNDLITVTKINPKGYPIVFTAQDCKINENYNIFIVGLNQAPSVVELIPSLGGWKLAEII